MGKPQTFDLHPPPPPTPLERLLPKRLLERQYPSVGCRNLYPTLDLSIAPRAFFGQVLSSLSTVLFSPAHSIRMRGFSPPCSSGDTRLKRSFPGRFSTGKSQVELLLDWTTKWLNQLYCFTDTIEQPHRLQLKTISIANVAMDYEIFHHGTNILISIIFRVTWYNWIKSRILGIYQICLICEPEWKRGVQSPLMSLLQQCI